MCGCVGQQGCRRSRVVSDRSRHFACQLSLRPTWAAQQAAPFSPPTLTAQASPLPPTPPPLCL